MYEVRLCHDDSTARLEYAVQPSGLEVVDDWRYVNVGWQACFDEFPAVSDSRKWNERERADAAAPQLELFVSVVAKLVAVEEEPPAVGLSEMEIAALDGDVWPDDAVSLVK